MPSARVPAGLRDPASYLPELESLRGWAILLVVVYHLDHEVVADAAEQLGRVSVPLGLGFVRAGHTGVSLFFVLSAFLLARPFLAAPPGPRAIRHFYARRALRILPAYYAALAAGTLLSAARAADVLRFVPYALFLHAWPPLVTPLLPYSAVWWSLATEVQFYLALPLLAWLAYTRIGRLGLPLLALAGVALQLAWTQDWLWPGRSEAELWAQLTLLGRAPAFAAGAAACWLDARFAGRVQRVAARSAWLRAGGADLALVALLGALGLLLARVATLGFYPAEAGWPVWHVPEALLWTALVLALRWLPLRLRPALVNRALGRLGTLSYSLYLIHFPLLSLLLRGLRGQGLLAAHGWDAAALAAGTAGAGLCVGLSALSYRFVELPFLRRKERVVA